MAKFSGDKLIIIATVVSAALLQFIDMSIVNVSLMQMMGNMGATLGDISWVITGYAASNVVMITLSGWLSAKIGRRNYFTASIVLFTVASVLCGLSTNVWELVAFRVIQGIGGGGLISTGQAILIESFPKEDLPIANAIFGMCAIIGPTIGPSLGGYITDNMSWPWIFYINVPVGIVATIFTLLFVKEPPEKMKTGSMDWLAIILLVVGIGATQIVLEKGESEDWFETSYITILTIMAVVGIVCFIWRQLVVENPVIDLRIMKNRTFSVGVLFNFILGFGLFASAFIVPIFCQNLLGFTATDTGNLMIPGSLATAVMMPIIGNMLRKRASPILLSGIGFGLFFIFTTMLSHLTLESGKDDFFLPLIIRGVGLGMIFIPLTTITLVGLSGRDIPQGTAISNMIRNLGGSFGTAIMTTFVSTRSKLYYDNIKNHVSMYDTITQERLSMLKNAFISRGQNAFDAERQAIAALYGSVMKQSMLMTYNDAFMVVGTFFLVCIPMLLLFKRKKKAGEQPEEVHIEMMME